MSVDLTRFDFHAMRFLNSEVVESMNSSEIGQYILLLCKAWVVGKDVSLPDDMVYLSAVAKGKISNKVLEQFPIVDTPWGIRRRNQVLYAEWLASVSRSESASERGQKGNSVRWNIAKESQSDGSGIAERSETLSPKPSQTKPNQINPSQDVDFRTITLRYRTAIGKGHSKSKNFRMQYADVCSRFGEPAVLVAFDEWAESNKWRADSLGNTGLRFFFSDVADIIEETKAAESLKPKETTLSHAEVERINQEENNRARAEAEKRLEKIREDEIIAEELKAAPFAC